jgi:hypothetical protein
MTEATHCCGDCAGFLPLRCAECPLDAHSCEHHTAAGRCARPIRWRKGVCNRFGGAHAVDGVRIEGGTPTTCVAFKPKETAK